MSEVVPPPMTLRGEVIFDEPPATLWPRLTDPAFVAAGLPQMRHWQSLDANQFLADIIVQWAGQEVVYPTKVLWYDLLPDRRAAMQMVAQNRRSGFLTTTTMDLVERFDAQTELRWAAEIQLEGTLRQLPVTFVRSGVLLAIQRFFTYVKKNR